MGKPNSQCYIRQILNHISFSLHKNLSSHKSSSKIFESITKKKSKTKMFSYWKKNNLSYDFIITLFSHRKKTKQLKNNRFSKFRKLIHKNMQLIIIDQKKNIDYTPTHSLFTTILSR